MIQNFLKLVGLDQLPVFEVAVLLFVMGWICFFVGLLIDFLVDELAFGTYLNAFLLFVFFAVSVGLYVEFYQPMRYANPPILLAVCIGASFAMLFMTAVVRKFAERS